MKQWEYILQCHENPQLVVGDLNTEEVKRFDSKAEAERILWSLDCLAVMKLRILQIPAGRPWPTVGWNDEVGQDPEGGQ